MNSRLILTQRWVWFWVFTVFVSSHLALICNSCVLMHDLSLVLNVIWLTFRLAVCSSWSISWCPMLRWTFFLFLCYVFGEVCLLLQLVSFSFAIQIHVRFASFGCWSVLFIHTVEIGILLRVLPSWSISKYWFGQTRLRSWVAAHHI